MKQSNYSQRLESRLSLTSSCADDGASPADADADDADAAAADADDAAAAAAATAERVFTFLGEEAAEDEADADNAAFFWEP